MRRHSDTACSDMKTPPRLQPLEDDGLIDKVLTQVKSGKEADVFVVRCGETRQCTKVFKEASAASDGLQFTRKAARSAAHGARMGRQSRHTIWLARYRQRPR